LRMNHLPSNAKVYGFSKSKVCVYLKYMRFLKEYGKI